MSEINQSDDYKSLTAFEKEQIQSYIGLQLIYTDEQSKRLDGRKIKPLEKTIKYEDVIPKGYSHYYISIVSNCFIIEQGLNFFQIDIHLDKNNVIEKVQFYS